MMDGVHLSRHQNKGGLPGKARTFGRIGPLRDARLLGSNAVIPGNEITALTIRAALSHMARMIIAIDGPAASGKGTLGKRLAHHYGYRHLDTGVIYRAVAFSLMQAGADPADELLAVAA